MGNARQASARHGGTRSPAHPSGWLSSATGCREVYAIAREALGNAFRHSGAQRVEAEVVFGTDRRRIRIGDDGKGIDADVLAKGSVPGHWGLPGMRERAKKLGAKLRVRSGPGTGTDVELEIPATLAYRSLRDDDSWWRRLRRRLLKDADDVE